MESNDNSYSNVGDESYDPHTAHDADDALRRADRARRNLAGKVGAPWWYHWGAALATTAVFVGLGLTISGSETLGTIVLVLGAIIGPALLMSGLRRATGVALDRYSLGLGLWSIIVFGLLFVAFPLHVWAEMALALPIAGVIAGVVTLWRERRIDTLWRTRLAGGAAGV